MLPSGGVLHSARPVAARDPRGFMWERALWLGAKYTGPAHKDSAREDYVDLWFLNKECANDPILTQEVATGDYKEYWTQNVM